MKSMLNNKKGGMAYLITIILMLIITLKLLGFFHPLARNCQNLLVDENKKIIYIDQNIK